MSSGFLSAPAGMLSSDVCDILSICAFSPLSFLQHDSEDVVKDTLLLQKPVNDDDDSAEEPPEFKYLSFEVTALEHMSRRCRYGICLLCSIACCLSLGLSAKDAIRGEL